MILNNERISIIGDSIDTFDQAGYKIDGYNMYYPSGDVTNVNQTWWMQVISSFKSNLEVNASSSGSRATATRTDRPAFYERVSLLGNPSIIFVTLGTNDSLNHIELGNYDYTSDVSRLNEKTFRTAYIKGIKGLKLYYPNAKIFCIAESMTDKYKESIRQIALTLNEYFIDASAYTQGAGVHPNAAGMVEIAQTVIKAIIAAADKSITPSTQSVSVTPMIPILYEANETAFKTNGLGRLSDAISCIVTEEVNGAYELKMTYPLDGRHVDDLEVNRIIYAIPSMGKHAQPFRIREINKSWGNKIQITARHFCYELSYYAVEEFGTAHRDAYNVTPILYDASDAVIGRLTDLTSINFRKDISANKFYMTLVYPNSGTYASSFTTNCHVFAQAEVGRNPQTFTITSISNGSSSMTISGQAPILNDDFTVHEKMNVMQALERVNHHIIGPSGSFPFTFEAVPQELHDEWRLTDREWWSEQPESVRKLIMGDDGMLIDVYGGEWEWDHYNCILHERRGVDTGVIYTYGKNITDINSTTNIDEFYSHAISYWRGSVSSSTNAEKVDNDISEYYTHRGSVIKAMDDTYDQMFPYKRTLIIDASSEFDEDPSLEELDDYTNWYIKQNDIGIPRATIHVDIVDLASTEEYKDFIPLETVHLCDYVTIIFPMFGVNVKEQISKIEYNVLTGKNNAVTIGDTKLTLADTIASNKKNIRSTMYKNRDWADRCAERAIRASSGWYGGNIKKKYNPQDHKQQEAYVMDTDNEDTASHVLKADSSGISASTSGTSGTYNALVALRNPSGNIGVNASMVNFGKVKSQAGNTSTWDLESGEAEMYLTQASVGSGASASDISGNIIFVVKQLAKIINGLGIGEVSEGEFGEYKLIVKGNANITGRLQLGGVNVSDKLGQIDGIASHQGTQDAWIASLNERVTNLGG